MLNPTGISRRSAFALVCTIILMLAIGAAGALGAPGDPSQEGIENAGQSLQELLAGWVQPLFAAGAITLIVFFFFTAKLARAAIVLVVALGLAPFVYQPDQMQAWGEQVYNITLGLGG